MSEEYNRISMREIWGKKALKDWFKRIKESSDIEKAEIEAAKIRQTDHTQDIEAAYQQSTKAGTGNSTVVAKAQVDTEKALHDAEQKAGNNREVENEGRAPGE